MARNTTEYWVPVGSSEQTTPTTATGLTVPTGATLAVMSASVQDVRFTDDGTTTPTAILGNLIKVGDPPFKYRGGPVGLANFSAFEVAGGALLDITYYTES